MVNSKINRYSPKQKKLGLALYCMFCSGISLFILGSSIIQQKEEVTSTPITIVPVAGMKNKPTRDSTIDLTNEKLKDTSVPLLEAIRQADLYFKQHIKNK